MAGRLRLWGGVGALVVALAAVPGVANGRTPASGLHGIVVRGPIAPVCRVGLPCSRPAVGVTLVFSRGGRVRARAVTAKDGSYRITLAPGIYGVRALRTSPLRPLDPARVTVERDRNRRLDFALDTGIR
jgi:hypothetical protein